MPKVPKARRPKVKRESARDLRAKLETLQSNYNHLEAQGKLRDSVLRDFAELLRPYIEDIAAVAAEDAVNDHEISDHMGKL